MTRARTSQDRRREQRAQVRRAILDATEALLLEGGYEAFSIRRLVERCGYTAPTVYHHFGDKKGLLDTLLEESYAKFAPNLRRAGRVDDPLEKLRGVAKAFVRFGIRHPNHYELLYIPREPDHVPPASVDEVRVELDQAWTELWEAGRLRSGDRESAAQALWTLCHGVISGHIHRPDVEWSKTLADDAIDALLRGLVDPPTPLPTAPPRGGRLTKDA